MNSADCDECRPGRGAQGPTAIAFSSLPFFVTFLFVSTILLQKIFPILAGDGAFNGHGHHSSKTFNKPSARLSFKRLSALTFSSTIALAAVLAELILCDISNTINPVARGVALHITVTLLLFFLIVVIPFLEIHSSISAAGYEYTGSGKGRLRLAWVLQAVCFTAWLLGFWWSGEWLLNRRKLNQTPKTQQSLTQSCLERVGVIGIFFMSLLSGFASVSSPWQTFGASRKPVTEADVARKEAGLQATHDMLSAKRSRLRALERKRSDAPQEGFFQKALGSIRGNANYTERKTLALEIAGLETMALSLSNSHSLLQSRLHHQTRSKTPTGRFFLLASYLFSLFCLYRILATLITFTRHFLLSSLTKTPSSSDQQPTTNTADPLTHALSLLTTHLSPPLNHPLPARHLSFLLSGLILLASFTSAMQTFRLFAKFLPSLLTTIQANLPLLVAQVCAVYVIGAALMLRGMVANGQVVGTGEGLRGLGGTQGAVGWVDGWFEVWFLGGVAVTVLGIWVGRKVGGWGEEWEDEEDVEGGKRS